MSNRFLLVEKLLNNYPTKAKELLIDYLKNDSIQRTVEQYIGTTAPESPDNIFAEQPAPLDTNSFHRAVEPRLRTQNRVPGAKRGPFTPSDSAGSVKSYTSSTTGAGFEKICLMPLNGEDLPVIARVSPVRHHLIGDNVIHDRGIETNPDPVNERVSISGEDRTVMATQAVDMTWRRRNSFKSELGKFYVVPSACLNSDVILGSNVPSARQLSSYGQEAQSTQEFYQQGEYGRTEELSPGPLHQAHASRQFEMPTSLAPGLDRVQAFQNSQRARATEQASPAANTPLAAQPSSSNRLKVIGLWDGKPIRMSFDPDGTAEDFYLAFAAWAERKGFGSEVERCREDLVLVMRTSKDKEETCEIGLAQAELDALWGENVNWMQKNKSPTSPHLYVTVEMDSG